MTAKTPAILALALLGAAAASANVVPTFISVTGTSVLYTYSYSLTVGQSEYVVTGDQLCLAVPGLAGQMTAPVGWTPTGVFSCPSSTGVTQSNVPFAALYTYTGAAPIPPGTATGLFTFEDSVPVTGLVAFGATSVEVSDNSPTANQGEVLGPASSVPEPATMAILGFAACVVLLPMPWGPQYRQSVQRRL